MTTCPGLLSKQGCHKESTSLIPTLPTVEFPEVAQRERIFNRHEAAKSVIETTLLKSAEILSDFTENTISQSTELFNNILTPDRFGLNPNSILETAVPRSATASNANSVLSNNVVSRKRPDMTKLPPSIVSILREDSNSSIPSIQKSKKYHYHSKKMALKQRDSSKEVHPPTTTISNENTVAKIVLVSTPLALTQVAKEPMPRTKGPETVSDYAQVPALKNEKKTVHVSSVVRKPEKVNIGVEKGVAFKLGAKTKSPYFNTFGDSEVKGQALSNRKWVVNVGNFLDDEISLALIGNNLTITGFRQPSLNYPEGQSVSETIVLPTEIDVNNLRIYRAKDAKAFLVIQEKQ